MSMTKYFRTAVAMAAIAACGNAFAQDPQSAPSVESIGAYFADDVDALDAQRIHRRQHRSREIVSDSLDRVPRFARTDSAL